MVKPAVAMSDLPAPQAQCPKCRNSMVYVTSLPYRGMRRTTYACYTCRQTRSYMLPEANTEGAAADSAVAAS
jgi:hypothetical protein